MNMLRLKELKDMKTKYLMILMTLTVAVFTFSGCSSDEPFITASEEDYPRILDPYFPDWVNGQPGEFKNFTRDINLNEKVVVTPAEHTTVTWYIDGKEVATGDSIDMPLLAGNYVLKVVARTNKGLETSRTGMVVVRPCEGDPVPGDLLFDRLVVPGTVASLHGSNMSKVNQVIIGGIAAAATYHSDGDYVTYTVPANLADGSYPLTVADATGFIYGGGTITVSSAPIINGNAFSGKAGGEVTIEGQNLDKMASISIGGKAATIVSKAATSLTFKAPELQPGDYDMTATDAAGKAVKFIAGSEFVEKANFNVTTETVLWKGAWQVTWGTPFNELQTTMASMVHAGTMVRVYVTGNGQGTMTTAWWNNILTGKGDPERGDIMISGDMVLEYLLTDYSMELMNTQDGVLIVGDGYTVLKVTAE